MKNLLPLLLALFAFSANAQLPSNNWQQFNLNGKVQHMKEYNFDESDDAGVIKKGKLNTITEYWFNKDGYLLEELVTNPDSIMLFKSIYTYDDTKLLLGKDIFFDKGPSTIQTRFKFSPEGKLLEETQFRSRNLEFTTQYEYNKAGYLAQKNILNWVYPDQSFKETFKYDDKGRLVEKYTDRVGVEYHREFYSYDENGVITKTGYAKKKAPADVDLIYRYEWDTNSNWTSLIEMPSEKKFTNKHVRERSYEYF